MIRQRLMNFGTRCLFAVSLVVAMSFSSAAEGDFKHLYVCRSPVLAFDFWNSLQEVQKKGIKLTPQIAEQICGGMKAGADPQCLRIDAKNFKPVAAGWGGALAMSDGSTKVWFHNPDAGGWVHPEYYVAFANQE